MGEILTPYLVTAAFLAASIGCLVMAVSVFRHGGATLSDTNDVQPFGPKTFRSRLSGLWFLSFGVVGLWLTVRIAVELFAAPAPADHAEDTPGERGASTTG